MVNWCGFLVLDFEWIKYVDKKNLVVLELRKFEIIKWLIKLEKIKIDSRKNVGRRGRKWWIQFCLNDPEIVFERFLNWKSNNYIIQMMAKKMTLQKMYVLLWIFDLHPLTTRNVFKTNAFHNNCKLNCQNNWTTSNAEWMGFLAL